MRKFTAKLIFAKFESAEIVWYPKKPLWALKGEGCTEVKTRCFLLSTLAPFLIAAFPHNIKTRFSGLSSNRWSIIESVKVSQPFPWCEFASDSRTVSTEFSRRTPCFAQLVKLPCFGIGLISSGYSWRISLYILIREGGGGIPFLTLKDIPWACPLPW